MSKREDDGLLFAEPVTPDSMVRRAPKDEPVVMAMLEETERLLDE